MDLKTRHKFLRISVWVLTALAFAGFLADRKWIAYAAVLLLIPWVALELRWWRCPKCGAFLGTMEKKEHCPRCGEKLDLR